MSLQYLEVHGDDLPNTADLEILAMLLGKCLDELSDLGIVVAGHSREEMVLKLVLHSSKEIFGHEVVAADSTCSCELVA